MQCENCGANIMGVGITIIKPETKREEKRELKTFEVREGNGHFIKRVNAESCRLIRGWLYFFTGDKTGREFIPAEYVGNYARITEIK